MMFIIIVLPSCEGSAVEEPLKGKVNLVLSSDTEIEVKSMGDNISANDFKFKFDGVGEYEYEHQEYYRYGEVQMPMEWYLGIYTLYAESCTPDEAENGFGCLRYAGESSPFAVISRQMTSVTVQCNVANFRVNVKFDDTMYEAFKNFKLKVFTVQAPEEDETEQVSETVDAVRILEFDPLNKVGYYNLQDYPINLYYTVYFLLDGAEIYQESITEFLVDETGADPAVINAGDDITLNVKYIGQPVVTDGVKFIVEGERTQVLNDIALKDYTQGEVKEEK